MCQAMQIKENA